MKKVKAWAVLDKKGKLRLWTEGRYAIYASNHGKDISFMRSKNAPENFVVRRVLVTLIPPGTKIPRPPQRKRR